MKSEETLNIFAEVISGLVVEHYQRHLAELDLTLPQVQALTALGDGPVTTGRLAERLQISAPAITQLTERLARKGLIERRAAEGDRRCVLLALSEKGTRAVGEFRRRRQDVFRDALAPLSETERRQVVSALERAVRAADNHAATGAQDRAALKQTNL